jgi:hypothetical protein
MRPLLLLSLITISLFLNSCFYATNIQTARVLKKGSSKHTIKYNLINENSDEVDSGPHILGYKYQYGISKHIDLSSMYQKLFATNHSLEEGSNRVEFGAKFGNSNTSKDAAFSLYLPLTFINGKLSLFSPTFLFSNKLTESVELNLAATYTISNIFDSLGHFTLGAGVTYSPIENFEITPNISFIAPLEFKVPVETNNYMGVFGVSFSYYPGILNETPADVDNREKKSKQ